VTELDVNKAVDERVDQRLSEMVPVAVVSNRWVTERLAAVMLGTTVAAIRYRRSEKCGEWPQGKFWKKDDLGSVWIDMKAVNESFEAL
jgi:hypothetical protein